MGERSTSQGERQGPLRLGGLYLRVGVLNELQYRANFFVQLVQSLLSLGTGLFVLALIYQRTDELGGWTRPQLLAVMGVFTLMGGIIESAIEPNMARLRDDVRLGTLDYVLTKPADSQLLVSVREFRLWRAVDVLVGLGVLVVAVVQLDNQLGLTDALAFVGVLLLGTIMIYCFWLAITTTVFWFVRMDEIQELFTGLYRAGQFPVTVYPGWLRYGLTFLVPIAFAVTVPSEALTDRLDPSTSILAAGLTLVLVLGTRWFWRVGIRHYDGASA